MNLHVIVQGFIVGFSMLACGFALWLAVANVRAAIAYRDAGPAFYALARFGLVIVITLVAEAVFRVPDLPVTFRTVLYSLGVLMVAVGYAGILIYERRYKRDPRGIDRKVAGGGKDVG